MVTIEPVEEDGKEPQEQSGAASSSQAADDVEPKKAQTAAKGAQASAGANPAAGGGLLARLSCRRRSKEVLDKERQQRYRDLFLCGRSISEKRKAWYDKLAWWSDCKTKRGGRIFVLAPRGPKGEHDVWIYMWELLGYAINKMHEYVVTQDNRFAVIWVQFGDTRTWAPTLMQFRDSLHTKYAKNFEALHVLHPAWSTRILRLVLWPIAPDDFWDSFHAHERIEFLDPFVDMRHFRLPSDIVEYDKWLDKQALEMSEQAKARGMGGFGATAMSEEDKKKHEEQMEQFKRAMAAKGHKQS